jgi:hypothetical protein
MKTLFDMIHVNYAEYSYFKKLPKSEKLFFLFELYEAAEIRSSNGIDLGQVFDMIRESLDDSNQYESHTKELPQGVDLVELMIDDDNIMVESNSIKAIKQIVSRFIESGYILRRDVETEKMFKRDKITRYLRIYRIIDQISTLCTN